MRCFCCNLDLGPEARPDRPTGRFYCISCFEPTLDVQLAAATAEVDWWKVTGNKISVIQVTETESSEDLCFENNEENDQEDD